MTDAFHCKITDQGFCLTHQERIGYRCIVSIRVLEARIADLEAELAMERGAITNRDEALSQSNAWWGVEYRKVKVRAEKAEAEVERLTKAIRGCSPDIPCSEAFLRGGRESGEGAADSAVAPPEKSEKSRVRERPRDADKAGQRSESRLASAAAIPAAPRKEG